MVGKRMFGDSGISVSPIGLGLAALGRPGYINLGHGEDLAHNYDMNAMETRTHDMLDQAFNAGINYFDAAQSYGKAEQFLGSWLKGNHMDSNQVLVGSKWGYRYTADWQVEAEAHEIKEHSLEVLNRQYHISTFRLRNYLKLYQIHSATFKSGVLDNIRVLDRLAEIQDEGTLIGLSLSGPEQPKVLEKALKISVEGRKLFDSVQITYNILEQSGRSMMQRAHDQGLGVIVKEGLANGRLTNRNTSKAQKSLIEHLDKLAATYSVGIDAISLAFILQQPFVHVVLSGAAQPTHLTANLKATGIELSPAELTSLQKFAMDSQHYWKERSALPWN